MSDPSPPAPSGSAADRESRKRPAHASRRIVLAMVLAALGLLAAGIGFEASRLTSPRLAAERFAYVSSAPQGADLPELWRVPEFSFRERDGSWVNSSALAGKVWIADFIFTTCTSVCPLLSAKLVMLQHQLQAPTLRFVSFSVDPEHDTPDVLARYAAQWNPGESRWLLLSTDAPGLANIAQGMRVAVEPTGDDKNPILHSNMFFLVDQRGNVRGVYDSADDEALKRLSLDARGLLGTADKNAALDGSGAQLFAALGCGACHDNERLAPDLRGLAGREVLLAGGDRVTADAQYLRDALLAPGRQLATGYLNIMPSYAGVLTSPQIDSLVAHLQTLLPAPLAPAPPAVASAKSAVATAGSSRSKVARPIVARAQAAQAPTSPSTDPVCKMQVRVSPDTPRAEHAGQSYYFCSATCRDAFAAHPDKYSP